VRRALVVAALGAALASACAVPAVEFDGGQGPQEAGLDAGLDGTGADATAGDATTEGGTDALLEGGVRSDAPYDGPPYCEGDAAAPDGGTCCGGGTTGPVCFGTCTSKSCGACTASGPCDLPNVCCTSGKNGTCQLPPC
jgi:hypothetical protein